MGACTGYVRDMYGISMGQLWGKRRCSLTDDRWTQGKKGGCLQEDGRCHKVSMDQERFYYGIDREELWLFVV